MQALYTAGSSMVQCSKPLPAANSAGLPRSVNVSQLGQHQPLHLLVLIRTLLTAICFRDFLLRAGVQASTDCRKTPGWPHQLGSRFACTIASLGAPQHAVRSACWEALMGNAKLHLILRSRHGVSSSPNSGKAAICACLGPVVSATYATPEH